MYLAMSWGCPKVDPAPTKYMVPRTHPNGILISSAVIVGFMVEINRHRPH